jgi:hypothetical protein
MGVGSSGPLDRRQPPSWKRAWILLLLNRQRHPLPTKPARQAVDGPRIVTGVPECLQHILRDSIAGLAGAVELETVDARPTKAMMDYLRKVSPAPKPPLRKAGPKS